MQYQRWDTGSLGGFWLAPAAIGMMLIAFGVLIFFVPNLLELIIAALFIFAGCSLLGLAWHLRGRTSYRRVDGSDPDDPDML